MRCRLINDDFHSNYGYNLLKSRGVNDVEGYLKPSKEYLINPTLLENIEVGAELYLRVVRSSGKILIVVDSDNDGFTSATIAYKYTKRLNPDIEIDYILHEGKQHGLQDHIEGLMAAGKTYDLIILPDSSSNDYKYHEMLKDINTACLVLDHHITDVELSSNVVVINNQLSPNYPNKDLTGAGVVYQFCRYLDSILGNDWADDYLDLAAWGIIGDMGSVLDTENRYIIYKGMKNIKNKLLLSLMEKQGYSITGSMAPSEQELIDAMNPISTAFYIVPLVNAMIRVGTMDEKKRLFEAFLDGDKMIPSGKRGAKGTLDKAGTEAARECTNARSRQNRILDAAVGAIEAKIFKYDLLENRVLFVRLEEDDDFPSELNGLVAMKLCAKFKRPTIVARLNNEGYDRGSMRGMNQSSLTSFKDFLESSGMFEYVSGHDNAAGVSIQDSSLRQFHAWANEELKDTNFGENVYDVNFIRSASSSDIKDIVADIDRYAGIWGQGNAEPLIHIKDININSSDIQVIGKNADTIKFEKFGVTYIKFHAKELIEKIRKLNGDIRLEVVGKTNMNEWMGRFTPQIMIEDCEFKQSSLADF